MKLSRDVFVALSTVAWADGVLKPVEAEALVRAASACGVSGEDLETVRRAVTVETKIDHIEKLTLQWDERLFVYAIAKWLMGIDGVVVPSEKQAVERLGDLMHMSQDDRFLAARASAAATHLTVDGRHDLLSLAREIEESTMDADTTIHTPLSKLR